MAHFVSPNPPSRSQRLAPDDSSSCVFVCASAWCRSHDLYLYEWRSFSTESQECFSNFIFEMGHILQVDMPETQAEPEIKGPCERGAHVFCCTRSVFWCQHFVFPVFVCFILPPEVHSSPAILKVKDDAAWGASVIAAIPPSPPSFHLLLSPSFLSCVLISLLCGSWYVDFIKFSSGWVMEKRGGDQGNHPLFPAFICPSSFIPTGGLWLLGPRGEKAAEEPLPSFGHGASPHSGFLQEQKKKR